MCAAADACAQTVLKKQSDGTRRYVHISSQNAAAVDAAEAARRLNAAQLARDEGVPPLYGELTNGEPNHRYWLRQEKLRLAVEEAQKRSNQLGRTSERAGRVRVAAKEAARSNASAGDPSPH